MTSLFDAPIENYETARDARDTITSFLEHPGWQVFSEFLTARIVGREKELVQMCPTSIEQMVQYARIKGGIEELYLIPAMLGQVLSDLDEFVKSVQEDAEDAEADPEEPAT